jgi:undecaprenyl-diphosphatase
VLALLVAVVVPVLIANVDALAVPVVTLAGLGATAVAVAGLGYWLLTRGITGQWLARHVHLTPNGTLCGGAIAVALVSGVGLAWLRAQDHRSHSALAQFNLRAIATATRLVGELNLMESLNQTGIRTMVLLGGLLVLAAVAVGSFRSAALLAGTMGMAGVLVQVLKTRPPDPEPALGLLEQHSRSWPSGHAALQLSFALGVVLWWWAADLPRPSIIAALVVPVAVVVGYSRAFIGIHWLSEVLAGWLVATVAAAVVLAADRLVVPRLNLLPAARRGPVLAAGIVAVAVAVLSVHAVHRFHDRGPVNFSQGSLQERFDEPEFEPVQLAAVDPSSILDPLPRYTETLLGSRGQAVNVVVVADGDRLSTELGREGWRAAAVVTPKDLASSWWAGVRGRTTAEDPVAPSFYNTRVPDLVLRRPAGGDGEYAYETQLWGLPVKTAGDCNVWVGTTAIHDRTQWDWSRLYPVRLIGPQVDDERDALARALASGSRFDDLGRFAFVTPGKGSGPGGSYTTDGKVALLRQPGCSG